jgi:hypothetical protein
MIAKILFRIVSAGALACSLFASSAQAENCTFAWNQTNKTCDSPVGGKKIIGGGITQGPNVYSTFADFVNSVAGQGSVIPVKSGVDLPEICRATDPDRLQGAGHDKTRTCSPNPAPGVPTAFRALA